MGLTTPDRLARLKALEPLHPSRAPEPAAVPIEPQLSGRTDWVASILGGDVARNHFGEYVSIKHWFPEPAEVPAAVMALRLLSPGAPEAVADPRQWLFLDTETTGLAGGTGTYAFLVGIAWWDAGGIQIEQLFMRDLDEEWPLLAALADRLEERPVLVTFNGKSFDWPLLETRYRLTRTLDPPELRAHLDLLHPARNLWRPRLGSVRLAELERHVLGWDRGADVMSDLIPQLYLDFLRGQSPEPLVPVLRHNQADLRGLAALSGRVLSLLAVGDAGDSSSSSRDTSSSDTSSRDTSSSDTSSRDTSSSDTSSGDAGDRFLSGHEPDALELFGVSRICERRGELRCARRLYQRSIAASLPAEADRAARKSLARLAKREKDYPLACRLWQATLGNSSEGLHAYEQLAIYYEHHARQPQRAAEITRQALAELRGAHRLGTIAAAAYRRDKARFEHRLARLERKASLSQMSSLYEFPKLRP